MSRSEASTLVRAAIALGLALLSACVAPSQLEQQCRFDSDCQAGLVCANGFCRVKCRTDRDCIPIGGACVPSADPEITLCLWPSSPKLCNYNTDCKGTAVCVPDGWCAPECRVDTDCSALSADARCGANRLCYLANFGSTCGPSLSSCAGSCVDLQHNAAHCGACDHACAEGERCAEGVCAVECNPPTTKCDGRCVDTNNDGQHCGGCGAVCSSGQLCLSGRCASACSSGERCGEQCVDVMSDAAHCGGCDRACPARDGARATCASATCGNECLLGRGDCDNNRENGCETDLRTSSSRCGSCTNACTGATHCVQGECVASDILARWSFDGDGLDFVGGYNLQLTNASFAPGIAGPSLSFDGTGTQTATRSSSDAVFDLTMPMFTLSVWVYFNPGAPRPQVILEKLTGSGGPGWSLSRTETGMISFWSNGAVLSARVGAVANGEWHNIMVSRSPTRMDVRVDGSSVVSSGNAPGAMVASSNPLLIGRRNSGDARGLFLDGRVDEIELRDVEIGVEPAWYFVAQRYRPYLCANATPITSNGAFNATMPATDGTYFSGSCQIGSDYAQRVYSIVVPAGRSVTIDTCGSRIATLLFAHSSCNDSEVACSDDSCGSQSSITLPTLRTELRYFVIVASQDFTGGPYVLNVRGL